MRQHTYRDEMGYHLKPEFENIDTVELLGQYENTNLEPLEIEKLKAQMIELTKIGEWLPAKGYPYFTVLCSRCGWEVVKRYKTKYCGACGSKNE